MALACVLGIFWFSASGRVVAGCSLLVFFGGSLAITSEFAGDLWVLASPLVFWLCYWSAYRGAWAGACAAGLRLLWPFLDLLFGGFGKIQMNQVIRFVIHIHRVGNADAKYHEIQFSNKCCCFLLVLLLLLSVNIYSRNLIVSLMLCL